MRELIWAVVKRTSVCPWTGETSGLVLAPIVLGSPITARNIVYLHKSVEGQPRPRHVVRMARLIARECTP